MSYCNITDTGEKSKEKEDDTIDDIPPKMIVFLLLWEIIEGHEAHNNQDLEQEVDDQHGF